MQIHELPAATPDTDDVLPFDTGAGNYKAPFSAFEAGGNNVTFTSDDTEEPTTFQTIPQVVTGTLATQMRRVSRIAANLRYVWAKIGTTAMGTTATTITAAIKELVQKIGSTATGLTATTITGMIKELRLAIGSTVSYTSSADQTVAYSSGDTNVYAAVGSVQLTKGTWIVICKVRFSSNSTGFRRMNFADTSGAAGWTVSLPAVSGGTTDMQMVSIIDLNDTATYYLNVWQNSGANLTLPSGRVTIRAMKVGVA